MSRIPFECCSARHGAQIGERCPVPPERGRGGPRERGMAPGWRVILSGLVLLLAVPAAALAQERITGRVTAGDDGRPLAGVSVYIKGTDIGTLTGTNGRYVLEGGSAGDTLVFALIGFRQQEVVASGRAVVDVVLEADVLRLDELVVVGYGTQQRRDVTGSVTSIEAEELAETVTPSVVQALQGKAAGVQVTPISGEPGQGAVVRIRGVGTLNDASPLYVVDGMLLDDIGFLTTADIESVQVLKDASATAIYGSRGANGVIIIRTRRGTLNRPTQFTARAYMGSQRVIDPIDMVNAQQYAMLANELAANTGAPAYFPDPNEVGPGTNWQDQIFDAAPIQDYQVTASGGTDRVTYYFGADYMKQAGVIPRSEFSRLTLRANNAYQLTDRVRIGHNLNFSHREDPEAPGVLRALYYADPTIPPRDGAGEFSNGSLRSSAGNPMAAIFYTHNEGGADRLVGTVYGEANIAEGFTFRSNFGLDYEQSHLRRFTPEFFVSPTQQNTESDLLVRRDYARSWLWDNTLTYDYASDRHRLSVLGGITAQSFYSERLEGTRTNVVGEGENLWYLNAGDAEGQTNANFAEDWRMLSYLFRTNYTFLDRYMFTGSLRLDGSSRFGEENRYGLFPSVAVGWDLSGESFLEDVDAISALKLRASWGKIGNDKIGAYPGVPVVTGNLNAVFGPGGSLVFGATPIELANPNVKWEETTQTNVGADVALADGRLQATLEYYNRETDGILVRVPIPRYVGASQEPFVNAARVRNRGIEGSLAWSGTIGGLRVDVGVNGATVDNEVLALGGGREEILAGGLGNEVTFTTRTVVGEPIGSFWGFKVEGVFQTPEEIANSPIRGPEQPGDLRYADLNGDGVITNDDKTFIGSPIPDFTYGAHVNLNWGAFDLALGFSGMSGNEVFNGKKAVRFGVENFETSYLDRWHGPGTSNTEPRVTNAGHNYLASERFIEDGSFFKVQSAVLGYRLPPAVTSRLNVDGARLYVSATNPLLLTDYSGYTPELIAGSVIASGIDLGVYPPARTVVVGVDVTF
ncbi:MAG TPA: TonB-dependent receptor [Longimicrobiales bacterium]